MCRILSFSQTPLCDAHGSAYYGYTIVATARMYGGNFILTLLSIMRLANAVGDVQAWAIPEEGAM